MKRLSLLCLTVWLSVATWAAYDFEIDGIYYAKLTNSTVEVSNRPTGGAKRSGDIVIPETVTYDDVPYTVVGIGTNAFYAEPDITSVTLPNTIIYINKGAFGSTHFTSINIPEGVTSIGNEAFYAGYLTSVTLPESLTSLGEFSFSDTKLTSINVPKNVRDMGDGVFTSCTDLTEVTLEEGLTVIGVRAFDGCVNLASIGEIPSSVTYIGDYAFSYTKITSVNIPKGVTTLGEGVFMGCEELSDVTLEEGLTILGDFAFDRCEKLEDITIPSSIMTIGMRALSEIGIHTLVIPSGVTTIGEGAFADCPDLEEVVFDEGFSMTYIVNTMFMGCMSLKSIKLPSSITALEDYAFASTGLTSLDFLDGLTSIGNYAFYYCKSLDAVTIPESITSLGSYAFSNCTGLTEATILANIDAIKTNTFYLCTQLATVSIPKTVSNIDTQAFYYCTSLTSITSLNRDAPICGTNVFYGVSTSKCKVYVPEGSEDAYRTAPTWEDFTNIVGIEVEDDPDGDETKFVEDGVYYQIVDTEALTVEVTYATTSFNYYSGVVNIPATFAHNGKEYTVVGIGYSAFRSSPNLTEVVFPKDITYIGTYAFYACTSLKAISFPSGVTEIGEYTCSACTALTEVTIHSNITSLDTNAFSGCTNIKTLTLEDGEETLEVHEYALTGSKIGSLHLGRNVSFFGSNISSTKTAFRGTGIISTITFGENISSLCDYEFYYCGGLTELTIPGHVTEFGKYVFAFCSDLRSVTISEGITALSQYMFANCTSLKNVSLPEGLVDISSTFRSIQGCGLEEITIPSTVTSASSAFYACSKLKKVVFTEGLTTISGSMFYECTALSDVVFPTTLTTISSKAFYQCTSLERVVLPEGVTSIADAFEYCTNLTDILLPQSLTSLADFKHCSSLKKVIVPKLVVSDLRAYLFSDCSNLEEAILLGDIESYSYDTFYGCSSLGKIYSLTSTPPSKQPGVGSLSLFRGLDTDDCVLYVPVGAKETYANDENWGVFTHIEELGEPLAITYGTTVLTTDSVEITGYIAVGSVGITEVGFEYWSDESDVKTITATVEDMKADLIDLPYATTYTYRAYAKTTSNNTLYGDNVTFTTLDGTDVDKIEEMINDTTQVGPATIEGYYTIGGQKLNAPQKGITIVRFADGSARKILINY